MVDIDRTACIFGSVARRKPDQVTAIKKKFLHDRSTSAPAQTTKIVKDNTRTKSLFFHKSFEDEEFKCPICRKTFEDTRVLSCLHTFCLKCVLKLEKDYAHSKVDTSDSKLLIKRYLNQKSNEESKHVCCPVCNLKTDIPVGGANYLPPNYAVQHKMVLATMNSKETHLLCDLCIVDVSAKSRCMDCAISFCQECEEIHLRQKSSANHDVLSLEKARAKGITKIRRRIMCMRHPDSELSRFCNTCFDVTCDECLIFSHQDHSISSIYKVAEFHLGQLKFAADQTRDWLNKSDKEVVRLSDASKDIEDRCNSIQNEVRNFMDGYILAIQEHKDKLLEKIRQFKKKELDYLSEEKIRLQKKTRDAREFNYFLSDLLNDGIEAEKLSFLKSILRKIKYFEPPKGIHHKTSGNLQFLPNEAIEFPKSEYRIFGDILAHSFVPELCSLSNEPLQNTRVGKKVELVLEIKDENNRMLKTGGEFVSVELLQRKAGILESYNLDIVDNKNGKYNISFLPEITGKYSLHIRIQGQPKEDSHLFKIHPLSQHNGIYHCCSFCSSGGSKQATPCGCGGQMPGGYRGCGHGHIGHPGQCHWSCCGRVGEYSECTRRQYQFTL